ncbi:acetylxylan esterase [Poriferisphaera sp. WC338]|uniref:acetylxylan esterase n=1 Tax=Poriferisphaera sp. WC338 TaxID=3425129 RepID=UPI003D817FC5
MKYFSPKRTTLLFLLFATLLTLVPASLQAALAFQTSVDREDAIYKQGEPATFTIRLHNPNNTPAIGESFNYNITQDGHHTIESGKHTVDSKPLVLTATLDKPGIIRLELAYTPKDKSQKKLFKRVAAAFDPHLITASLPEPDDFKAFWAAKRKLVEETPLNAKLTPVKNSNQTIEIFDVQADTPSYFNGKQIPLSGYFARPKNAKPKSLPAIITPHSAGVRSSNVNNTIKWSTQNFLIIDFNAHGLPNGKPHAFYQDQNKTTLKSYPAKGKTDRDQSYFTNMLIRQLAALKFIKSQPEWDGKTLIVLGSSQGGGQAFAAAGVDPDITMMCASVPAMSDHTAYEAGRMVGWPRLLGWTSPKTKDETYKKTLEASRYVDAVNFARHIKAKAIVSVGLIDHVCCPSSVYAAFNTIPHKNKTLHAIPDMGHNFPRPLQDQFDEAILKHVKDMQTN